MWLSKRPLFLGIALGFLACCGFGRLASRQPMFEHFLRFTFPIQPQNLFYPTASELVSYLQHQMIPGKKLALIGGASYLRGTGQNPGELWSLKLQQELGADYQVINFAIDGAGVTSFAAVPFQILEPRHPEMIYISNGSPVAGDSRDGGEIYRYVFWDAYYKGLLPAAVTDAPAVRAQRAEELRTADGLELHLGKWIDSWTYACDLWNYIGYKWLFTAWSNDEFMSPLKPRREYREKDNPALLQWQKNNEHDPVIIARAEAGGLGLAESGYTRQPNGHWKADPSAWSGRRENWRSFFPAEMRARTFVIFLRPNPYYLTRLSAEDSTHYEHSYTMGRRFYEAEGYHVVQFDRGAFGRDDFLDSGHLLPSGGNKVAVATAARIAEVTRENAAAQAWLQGPTGPLQLSYTLPAQWPQGGLELLRIEHGGQTVERVIVESLGQNRIRYGYRRPPETPVYSAPENGSPGETRQLEASVSGLYLPGEARTAAKSWFWLKEPAGGPWVMPIDGADQPLGELVVGSSVAAHRRLTEKPEPPIGRPYIGAVVRLTAAPEAWDRSLPLATTGHTGAGDVLVATWSATGALSFAYDHWNDGERHSPEFSAAPGSEHEVEFRLPALAGGKQLTVWLDGKVFWQTDVPSYTPAPGEVYWGQNPIRATSAELSLAEGQFVRLVQ
jgi:hypothetical protein